MNISHEVIEQTIAGLSKNHISAQYIELPTEIYSVIETFISQGITVGIGDSETMSQLNIYNYLRQANIVFLDKYERNLSKEEKKEIYIKNFSSDLFISGINALTIEGKIFNLDGNGSRVAPMIYGPKKVLLICGTNKIVKSDTEAFERIRNIAAPKDAKRLNKKTPCVITGKCVNCSSADKICNYYSIIQGQFDENRIHVLIINGNYGF
jgi:Uncharacterised ACR, YkgG family COG1556.